MWITAVKLRHLTKSWCNFKQNIDFMLVAVKLKKPVTTTQTHPTTGTKSPPFGLMTERTFPLKLVHK